MSEQEMKILHKGGQLQENLISIPEVNEEKNRYIPVKELIKEVLPYGFLSYGGPMAHIGMFRQKFVEELKWLSEQKFTELFAIAQSIPGPTSTQLMIAIGTLASGGAIGGLISFLLFCGPASIVLLIFGLMARTYEDEEQTLPDQVFLAFKGFQAAAVAIVASAAIKLSQKQGTSKYNWCIILGSGFLYYMFQHVWSMLLLLAGGASLGYFNPYENQNNSNEQAQNQQDQEDKEKDSQLIQQTMSEPVVQKIPSQSLNKMKWFFPFGKPSLILYGLIFVVMLVGKNVTSNLIWDYCSSFYYIGSIIVGGGHVVLPLMFSEFTEKNYITPDTYWQGFSIVSALPGPMFNFSVFIGAVTDGVRGAVLSWFSLFLPAFLTIWGLLPFWDKYRNNPVVKRTLDGLSCASVGLVLTATVLLYQVATEEMKLTQTLISIIAFIMLHIYELPAPLVIFIGGVLTNVRQLVLVNYRGVDNEQADK